MNHKLESRMLGEISITSDMQMPNMSDSTESEKILCSLTSKTGDCYLLLITRRLEIYSNNWHVDTLIYTDEWSNKLYYIKKNEEYIE